MTKKMKIKITAIIVSILYVFYTTYSNYHLRKENAELEKELEEEKHKFSQFTCPDNIFIANCDEKYLNDIKSDAEIKNASVVALRLLENKIRANSPFKEELDILISTIKDHKKLEDKLLILYEYADQSIASDAAMLLNILNILDSQSGDQRLSSAVVDKIIKIESKKATRMRDNKEDISQIVNFMKEHNYKQCALKLYDISENLSEIDSERIASIISNLNAKDAVYSVIEYAWDYMNANILK